MAEIVKIDQSVDAAVPEESFHQREMRRQTERMELNRLKRKDREEEVEIRKLELEVEKQELDSRSRKQHIKVAESDDKFDRINKYYELYKKFKPDDDVVGEYGTVESHMAFQCRKEIEDA